MTHEKKNVTSTTSQTTTNESGRIRSTMSVADPYEAGHKVDFAITATTASTHDAYCTAVDDALKQLAKKEGATYRSYFAEDGSVPELSTVALWAEDKETNASVPDYFALFLGSTALDGDIDDQDAAIESLVAAVEVPCGNGGGMPARTTSDLTVSPKALDGGRAVLLFRTGDSEQLLEPLVGTAPSGITATDLAHSLFERTATGDAMARVDAKRYLAACLDAFRKDQGAGLTRFCATALRLGHGTDAVPSLGDFTVEE